MKILFISRSFNKSGGIPRYVVELSERFVENHRVYLLTTDYDYEIPNLVVHKKPMIRKPFWLQILSNAYYNTKYTKRLNKKFGFDIIHSQGTECLNCDVLTAHSCHKIAIKKLNKVAKTEFSYPKYLFYKIARKFRPLNKVVLSIEKYNLEKGCKKIIAVSKGLKREILENYKVQEEKIIVIPNGVDLKEYKPDLIGRKRIRQEYGISENKIVLLFCGYEFRRKGLKFIIEALPYLKDNPKLIVIGGENPKPYKKLAADLGVLDKIIFTGIVKKGINAYYAASDIFVFPTAYEAFSFVTLEAVASGLSLLTTKVNGTEELVEDGYNGFFIKRDPMDIAKKVNLLTRNENLRKQIGENARRTAEKYSWNEVAERTLKVYREVLKKKYDQES